MKNQYAIKIFTKDMNDEYDGKFIIESRIGESKEEVLSEYVKNGIKATIFKERPLEDPVGDLIKNIPANKPEKETEAKPRHFTPLESKPEPKTEVIEFENGEVKFKIDNGKVTKFDWSNEREFKISLEKDKLPDNLSKQFISKLEKLLLNKEIFQIQIKQWIEVK